MSNGVLVPVSIGDLYDKISILEIKAELIYDKDKIKNIQTELNLLIEVANSLPPLDISASRLRAQLKEINRALWDNEESIRDYERKQAYGKEFVAVARAIHRNNDRRAEIKKQLNLLSGSSIIEEKSYQLPAI